MTVVLQADRPGSSFTDPSPDYLLGFPGSYGQGSAQVENVRSTALYLFAQDSWKLRPNITLNYGLRWELTTPITDISQHVQTFRPGQNSKIYPCQLNADSIATFQGLGVANPDCDNTGYNSYGIACSRRSWNTPGFDADLLQGICAANRNCVESRELQGKPASAPDGDFSTIRSSSSCWNSSARSLHSAVAHFPSEHCSTRLSRIRAGRSLIPIHSMAF